jgi:hypothetical protein
LIIQEKEKIIKNIEQAKIKQQQEKEDKSKYGLTDEGDNL